MEIGTATVILTGIGDFEGSMTATFIIENKADVVPAPDRNTAAGSTAPDRNTAAGSTVLDGNAAVGGTASDYFAVNTANTKPFVSLKTGESSDATVWIVWLVLIILSGSGLAFVLMRKHMAVR